MVTGNAGSKDIDGARAVGMQSILIRQPQTPQTIIELAELLGC
jgi:FMN phosphatase YigB (HAD superfamily)